MEDSKISNLMYVLKYFDNLKSIEKQKLFFQLHNDKVNVMVNWSKTYALGIKLNFLTEKNNFSKITSTGKIFYSMSDSFSKLTSEQKFHTFKNGILNNTTFKFINHFLKSFSMNKENVLELFNKKTYANLTYKDRLILHELDVLIHKANKITVNEEFTNLLFNQKILGKPSLSQSELDRINAEKKEIGDRGEKLTLEYEKEQFKQKKWFYQEKNVRIIGKKNVNAGYDVESFLTKDSKLDDDQIGDKHIEVKSRKYDEFSFFISANELKMGKHFSSKKNHQYLIYFWNNLGRKITPKEPTKIIPFENLNITPCENCVDYLVHLDKI